MILATASAQRCRSAKVLELREIAMGTVMRRIAFSAIRALPLSAVAALVATAAAAAGPLVAIVEDVAAPSTDLQVMDYLAAGTKIRLKQGETLTISYFRSCSIEKITAGSVLIGIKRSRLSDKATVKRRFVECQIRGVSLTPRQAGQSAAIVIRRPPVAAGMPDAASTVYSTAPVFVLSRRVSEVVIERKDPGGRARHRIATTRGRADLMDTKIRLAPGAIYSATTEFGATTFKIAPYADDGETFLIRRLIAF
jgi:hypothetical protein